MAADDEMNTQMDAAGLYLEEVFTDRQVGTIMRLAPVDGDGKPDSSRKVVYVGQSQIMTPGGALPLNFEIEAGSLKEAAEQFGDAVQVAANETIERLKELRREAASSLVMPEGGMPGGGMGGGIPGGGLPGGGKIQLR
jgi:hypothetical protein